MKQIENFTISEFFFDIPLYTEIKITDKNISILEDILLLNKNDISFEGYNPIKKFESTFIIERRYEEEYHPFDYSFKKSYKNIIEDFMINGGYRTIADFHIHKIKQYDNLKYDLKEFTKAIGLAANGVGIGSFVYLRRIFENLILESFKEAKLEGKVEEETFSRSRMDEKIELLKDYLPSFLVENKSIYSILSKGIHELDENTCLEYFDPMKVGIEIILDQKLEKKKQKEKEEEAKKRIAQLNSKLKP